MIAMTIRAIEADRPQDGPLRRVGLTHGFWIDLADM